MIKCNVIGIDLAKNIIQVCVISKEGELISNKSMAPKQTQRVTGESEAIDSGNGR